MFTFFASVRVLAIPLTILFVGMIFLPADALYLITGGLTVLVGLVMLFIKPTVALVLIPVGGLMIAASAVFRRRAEKEHAAMAEAASEDARRRSRAMDPRRHSDD